MFFDGQAIFKEIVKKNDSETIIKLTIDKMNTFRDEVFNDILEGNNRQNVINSVIDVLISLVLMNILYEVKDEEYDDIYNKKMEVLKHLMG